MGLFLSIGMLLVSVSVCSVVAAQLLLPRPYLIILTVAASFTWSISLVASSAIWFSIPPLKQRYAWPLFLAVTGQELSRWIMFEAFAYMRKMGEGVEAFVRPGTKNRMLSGLAVGLGYSIMSVLINFYSFVADFYMRETAVYLPTCSRINFFVLASSLALAVSISHLAMGLLVWPAYDLPPTKKWANIAGLYVYHLGIAFLGLFSQKQDGCVISVSLQWTATVMISAYALVKSIRMMKHESFSTHEPMEADGEPQDESR